jgi:MYXO-CTERM domain-containing protein
MNTFDWFPISLGIGLVVMAAAVMIRRRRGR